MHGVWQNIHNDTATLERRFEKLLTHYGWRDRVKGDAVTWLWEWPAVPPISPDLLGSFENFAKRLGHSLDEYASSYGANSSHPKITTEGTLTDNTNLLHRAALACLDVLDRVSGKTAIPLLLTELENAVQLIPKMDRGPFADASPVEFSGSYGTSWHDVICQTAADWLQNIKNGLAANRKQSEEIGLPCQSIAFPILWQVNTSQVRAQLILEARRVSGFGESIDSNSGMINETIHTIDRQDPIEWTTANGPKQWAKVFDISTTTLKRRFRDGVIRHKKLSSKSYQIAIDDLPAKHQVKYRNDKKQTAS